MQKRNYSDQTIKNYLIYLRSLPVDISEHFKGDSPGKKNRIHAFRLYLKYLRKIGRISREELLDALEEFTPPIERGNKHSDRKWAVSKDQWASVVKKAPNHVAKMGIWVGFNFGLRLGEILHLRIRDLDFSHKEILIRKQENWNPKYNRERQVPFTAEQGKTLKRWISERPVLNHDYLLWTLQGLREGQLLLPKTFQRWCSQAGVHPHVLRYSFATHYYNESKDVKLISELLGHASVAVTSDYLQLGKQEVMTKARKLFSNS